MCDKKEKIFFILCELQKLSETDNGLLKELEQIHEILKHLFHDWEKVTCQIIGLWENYAGNPDISEDKKKRVNTLINMSVDALRKLSENQEYLQNTYTLTENLILKLKEFKSE
ncbi:MULTISPECIES: hypothetical protein [Bacteroidales]|uniref:hypothetical protein n=1 Tax=Bacteroidales TaxID=171549 RepID=UPI00259B841D|nr:MULTISPECIES: hypothetical protein [Bacteroidales]